MSDFNQNLAELTICDLMWLKGKLEDATMKEAQIYLSKFKKDKDISEKECLAAGRMAVNFEYSGP